MKFTAQFDESRLRKKLASIGKTVSKESEEAVKFYGQSFCKLAYKFTPPGNGSMTPAQGIRRLKDRIRRDLLGDKVVDGEMGYYRRNGKLFCYYKTEAVTKEVSRGKRKIVFRRNAVGKRPSPFHLLGRVPKGITPVHPEMHLSRFRLGKRGGAVRLIWWGERAPARRKFVQEAARRRQVRAGRLMAGWNEAARLCGARIPASVPGSGVGGAASIDPSWRHGAILKATNADPHGELKPITKRFMGSIQAAALRAAKTRARILKRKLREVK